MRLPIDTHLLAWAMGEPERSMASWVLRGLLRHGMAREGSQRWQPTTALISKLIR
jgi:hypothetical protein